MNRSCAGPWKLNVSLLEKEKIVQDFKTKLEQWKSLRFMYDSVGDWWEDMKRKSKYFFTLEGRKVAAKKRAFLGRLQGRLQRCYLLTSAGFDTEAGVDVKILAKVLFF